MSDQRNWSRPYMHRIKSAEKYSIRIKIWKFDISDFSRSARNCILLTLKSALINFSITESFFILLLLFMLVTLFLCNFLITFAKLLALLHNLSFLPVNKKKERKRETQKCIQMQRKNVLLKSFNILKPVYVVVVTKININ